MLRHRTLFGHPLGITLIVIQKSIWALVLVALSVALFSFRAQHVTQPFQELFEGELAEDPHDLLATLMIHLVPMLSLRTELVLGLGAILYAVLEVVEAWGLWRLILWVELLTVVETCIFLPYEVWDMFQHLSALKVLSFVINLLVVWYLFTRYLRRRAEQLVQEAEQVARHVERELAERRSPCGD
jgi:uncharacterized membrane protein (DUF2068 family)